MSEFPDYYAILGIPKTATNEEIRIAYKRESLRYSAHTLLLIICYVSNHWTGSGLTLIVLRMLPPPRSRRLRNAFKYVSYVALSLCYLCRSTHSGHSRRIFRVVRPRPEKGVRFVV